jgi:hypothetical protein
MMAMAAVWTAIGTVLRAPLLFVAVVLVTIATAIPFAAVVGAELESALAAERVSGDSPAEIDAEWWQEFEAHATGLVATFTPQILGFAAPLDALSGLLDGERRPLVLFVPIVAYALVWAFLWGGILERYSAGRRLGAGAFVRACARSFPLFVAIGAAAALATIALYFTVHALLFGPVFARVAASAPGERAAFFWRLGFYAVFATMLMAVNAIAELSRVHVVTVRERRSIAAVGRAVRFLRAHAGAVALLYIVNFVLFAALFGLYGVVDLYGGARVGGWRGVAIGQAYIFGRLFIKLLFAASLVVLVQRIAGQRSRDAVNPGPPAAT